MSSYYEWSQPMSADPDLREWSIEFPTWAEIEWTMGEGTPVTNWDPSLTACFPPYGVPMDFRWSIGGDWHIYSGRLKTLVESAAPGAVQYLLFRLRASIGSDEIPVYWVANHLRLVDCLDKDRTTLRTPTWEPINPLGDFSVRHAVLSRRRIGGEMLFRVKGDSRLVVVRDDLKDRIEAAGMTGCLFGPVDVGG